jgi:hypothetical protein
LKNEEITAMKLFKRILVLMFSSMVCAVMGQTADVPNPREMARRQIEEQQKKEEQINRLNDLKPQPNKINTENLPSLSNIKLTEKDRKAIAINKEDAVKYAAFLKQPHTGIIRLHDIFNCQQNQRIYNVEDSCPPNIAGKAGSYSFGENKYTYKSLSNITLEKSSFRSLAVNTLGVFTNLGDVELGNITLSTNGIKEMAEFEPSVKASEIKDQHAILTKGFQIGIFIYRTSLPLKENSTYALRSIAYRDKNSLQGSEKSKILLQNKRLDIIVVLRVIRNHEDGSYSLLWKELRSKKAPKIQY